MATLTVTTTETVEVKDEKVAQYIAALIDQAQVTYTDAGWSLSDLGSVSIAYETKVVG